MAAHAGDLVVAVDRRGLYVVDAAPRVRARLDLPFEPTGVVAHGTHALVVGDGPTLAWVGLDDADAPKLLRVGSIEGGARLVSTWNTGDEAWLALAVDHPETSIAGTLRWLDPITGQPTPLLSPEPEAGPLTALFHVELADAEAPIEGSSLWGALQTVIPSADRVWIGLKDRSHRAVLPAVGPPSWSAAGSPEPSMLEPELPEGSGLRVERGELVAGKTHVLLEALHRPEPATVACVANPRPPPAPPPTLGRSIILVGDLVVAKRPGTDELWRVSADGPVPIMVQASGLWRLGNRVLAMADGGQRLVVLDAELSHVERSVPVTGNVVDVEVSARGAWILLRTGDSACGSALVHIPADPDGNSRIFGLAGRPVDLALHEGNAVVAMDTDEGGLVATLNTAGEARARFAAQASILAVAADADGVQLLWSRPGTGTAISVLDPSTFADAPATLLDGAPAERAWLTATERWWSRADTLCTAESTGPVCVPSASPDALLDLAGRARLRFGDLLLRFEDGQQRGVSSSDLVSGYCATLGGKRSCSKPRKAANDTPADFAVDGSSLAVVDAKGLSVRDLRTATTRLEYRFPTR